MPAVSMPEASADGDAAASGGARRSGASGALEQATERGEGRGGEERETAAGAGSHREFSVVAGRDDSDGRGAVGSSGAF